MALQNTNLIIVGAQLPATFVGTPNDLFRAMLERMKIVSPTGVSFFVTGDIEPSGNQGPWLKSGVEWFVWDPDLKHYVPLKISSSEQRWFWMGSTTPPNANPPVWLKTTGAPSEANPMFGDPVAWFVYTGTEWRRMPTVIDDRSLTQAKLDFKANFFGTASGTNNYSITFSPGGAFHYGNGTTEAFFGLIKFSNANTGPATLSIDGGGGAPIKKRVTEDLAAGEIAADSVHALIFDGTNFQILSPIFEAIAGPPPAIGGVSASEGLVITNDATTPDEILTITANAALLQDASGHGYQASAVNLEVDITTSGLGGVDTGSSVSDNWYYIWLVSNGSDVAAVLSLSSSTPVRPAAYVFTGLLGAVFNDSSNDLTKIWQTGRRSFIIPTTVVANAGPALLPISDEVPPIAKTVFGTASIDSGVVNGAGSIRLSGDSDERGLQVIFGTVSAGVPNGCSYFHTPLITPQNIFESITGTAGWNIDVAGYTI